VAPTAAMMILDFAAAPFVRRDVTIT
jgi:hypothetical protein